VAAEVIPKENQTMKRQLKSGFTLVEILIVVLIIALLALLVLPNLTEIRRKAQRSDCLHNLSLINSAYQQYYLENRTDTPPALSAIANDFQSGSVPTCPTDGASYVPPASSSAYPTCPNSALGHVYNPGG
jgi:prepilin-type N-terminal cleavage/methylation domain-containing protein